MKQCYFYRSAGRAGELFRVALDGFYVFQVKKKPETSKEAMTLSDFIPNILKLTFIRSLLIIKKEVELPQTPEHFYRDHILTARTICAKE